MSDQERPEREAIERLLREVWGEWIAAGEKDIWPLLERAADKLAALPPTPTPGWQRGKWQVEVYQPTDGSKTTWVHLKDGDVIVQQWMVAHPGMDFDNMTDWHKTLAILALPPAPTGERE